MSTVHPRRHDPHWSRQRVERLSRMPKRIATCVQEKLPFMMKPVVNGESRHEAHEQIRVHSPQGGQRGGGRGQAELNVRFLVLFSRLLL